MTLRYRLLTLALLLSPLVTLAQPRITLNDILQQYGKTYVVGIFQDFNPDTSAAFALQQQQGANQTWDLTGFTFTELGTAEVNITNELADVPGSDHPAFSDANYAVILTSSDTASTQAFNQVSINQVEQLGFVSQTPSSELVSTYSPPRLSLPLPYSFGQSFDVTTTQTITIDGSSTTSTLRDQVEAVGYGTLITPAGTFENVIQQQATYTTTTNVNGMPSDNVTEEVSWISTGLISQEVATISRTPPLIVQGQVIIPAEWAVQYNTVTEVTAQEAPGGAPTLSSPDDGAEVDGTDVTLAWAAVEGAETYDVQISTDANFSFIATGLAGLQRLSTGTPTLAAGSTFFWRVRGANAEGKGPWSAARSFTTQTATSLDPTDGTLPATFALHANYPNPFNPQTTIGFDVPTTGPVQVTVHDVLGRTVATLVDDVVPAGTFTVRFDAGDLPSGAYLYRLRAGSQQLTRTLTLLR